MFGGPRGGLWKLHTMAAWRSSFHVEKRPQIKQESLFRSVISPKAPLLILQNWQMLTSWANGVPTWSILLQRRSCKKGVDVSDFPPTDLINSINITSRECWITFILTFSLPERIMGFCEVALTFESVDEILWSGHWNQTLSVSVLSHGAFCFSKFTKWNLRFFVEFCLWPHLAVKGSNWCLFRWCKLDRFSLHFHFRLDSDESGPQVMYWWKR